MPNWKKIIVSGSDAALNSLNITTSLTASGNIYPTGLGIDRQVLKTDGAGNITFGYPEDIVAIVKNVSGGTLLKGTPVHATESGAFGNIVGIIAASASDASTMPATFVLNETLIDEAEGEALAVGFIQGVDTSAFEVGQVVYVGPNGGYVGVKPTGSNLIQNLGVVSRVSAMNGSGYILGAGRSNDIPNIQPGYVWVGDSDSVATPIATSSIQNVISSSFATSASYAVTASHALNAGGTDTIEIMYFTVNNTSLADTTTYFFTQNTSMGTNNQQVAFTGIPAGTVVGWRATTYNASTVGSSETGTLTLFWDSGASSASLSTSITWDGNRSKVFSGSLSQAVTSSPSFVATTTPAFATNPTAVRMNVILQIEI
jgi:hypothetical protein